MAEYDGSIRINTKIDTKDAKVQLSALQHAIAKTADEIKSLRSRMDALKDVKTPTEAYEEMEKQLLSALNTLEELEEKQRSLPKEFSQMSADELAERAKAAWEEFNKTTEELSQMDVKLSELEGKMEKLRKEDGDPNGILPDVESEYNSLMAHYKELQGENSKTLKQISAINDTIKISEKIEKAKESVAQLNEKLKEMEDTGKAFSFGTDTEEYQNLARQLKNEQKALAKMKFQYAALGGFEKLGKIKESFRKLGDTAKKAFSKVDKSARKSGGSISSFGKRIKGLVASALIFNQVSKAINAMVSGMKEGFGNLYKEVDSFKGSVDGLKASTLTLKNSLAAAFRPLVEVAIPYIQAAIGYITRLADSFGQLIAAITGQKTYTKAIKQTTAALEEAKEAEEGYLSPLDEIHKYKAKDTQSGSGGAASAMFEEAPISDRFKELAARIKEIFSGIFDVFKKAWKDKGESVIKSAKAALGSILDVVKSIGTTFYSVFTNGTGLLWAESLLELLRSALDVVHSIASSFAEAWNNGAGSENVSALFEMLMDVNNLLVAIGDSFSQAFSSGIGTEIWSNLLGILTGIYNVIGNIAEQIEVAWGTAGFGDSIWGGILNLVNIILGTIHDIIDSTASWAANLDFTPLLQSIDTLLKGLQPLAENIGEGLKWFWDNVLLPMAGFVIEDAVPAFLDMLSAAIGVVNEVIEALKPLGMWLWEEFLQPLGQWAGEAIIVAMETITDLLKKFGNWISENQGLVENFVIIIGSFFAAWKIANFAKDIGVLIAGLVEFISTGGLATAAANLLGGAIGFLTSPIGIATLAIGALIAGFTLLYKNSESFRNFIDGIVEGAKNLIPGIIEGIKSGWAAFTDWLGSLWQGIVDGFKNFFGIHSPSTLMAELGGYLVMGLIEGIKNLVGKVEEIWESMKQFAEDTWNSVKDWMTNTWSSIKQTASQKWGEIKQNLSERWSQMKSDAKSKFSEIGANIANTWAKAKENTTSSWNTIKEKAVSASNYVKNGVTNAWNALKNATSNIWNGIVNAIKKPVNAILGFVESMANGVVKAINTVIRALNGLHFTIPSWVPLLGGNSFGFNIPELSQVSIPRLATGTVVPPNREFMAVLGDNKREPEVVSPISTMKQAVLEAIAESGGIGSGKPVNITLQVSLDRKVLGQTMVDWGKLQQMATGNNPYALGTT